MPTMRDILGNKQPGVWQVAPDATVYEALELMAKKNVGALPVVEREKIVGIFSERDYARNVVLKGKSSRETPVRELMIRQVLYVRPEQTVDDAMALMTEKRVRHLPVLEDGKLIGIVSIGDLVRRIITEKQHTIDLLENYIKGEL